MRFWDTSAVVPLLVREHATTQMQRALKSDQQMIVWWATPIECVSALARLERDESMSTEAVGEALGRLAELELGWHEIEPSDRLRSQAMRLLRVHSLRAADALQLAAAIVAAEFHPPSLSLICLDDQLLLAAEREGFTVVGTAG